MVSLALATWAWPLCVALALSAWQVWPVDEWPWAALSLALAVPSAWALNAPASLAWAFLAAVTGLRLKERETWFAAVTLPVLLLGLLRARLAWLPVLPGNMAFWAGLATLTVVCLAGQGMLAAESQRSVARALWVGQAAWCLFGLVTGSPMAPVAFVGLLGLVWQQPLLRLPLQTVLGRPAPPAFLTALLFLGLGGCLGLSAFSAYFQLFIPLMGQGEAVSTMQAKLFSGAGLLAAVAMLAVLVQTCAFGYFYWLRVLPHPEEGAVKAPLPGPAPVWPWLALGSSLAWGLRHYAVSGQAIHALQAIGVTFPLPSS